MPTLGTTGLVLAYVALAVILLSLHLYSNWKWWVKAGATIMLLCFYYITYLSIPPLLGWPTTHQLPEKFRLIAYTADENRGIYIWANDLRNGVKLATPRAYMLPYSKTLHTNIDIAAAKIRRGGKIIGEISEAPAVGPNAKPKGAEIGTLKSNKIQVNFIDAPEALIPEKGQ